VPSDFTLKTMNAVHRGLLKVSFGHLGWKAGKMPVIELTTTGRKTGKPHSVMLTSPLQEGNTVVVVASRGGDDRHPAWFLNLQANPEVEVAYEGKPKQAMKARAANPEERARMWPIIASEYKNYGAYQQKTSREIPLVLLEPLAST
jgi:deazaflavin-dependent oxidoreductase (nitroreductase family)